MSITKLLTTLSFQQTKYYNIQREAPRHVVLDLETMGLGADAAVVSIGAVGLDADYNLSGFFHVPLNLDDVLKHGCTVDASTIQWWLNQTSTAREALDLVGGLPLEKALDGFTNWLTCYNPMHGITTLWGNGPEFDNALLANLYNKAHKTIPWGYKTNQSMRTLRHLARDLDLTIPQPIPIIPHNALFDAWAEALFLKNFYFDRRECVRPLQMATDLKTQAQQINQAMETIGEPQNWGDGDLVEARAKERNAGNKNASE